MEHDSPWYRVLRTPDGRLRLETYAPVEDFPPEAARRLREELRPVLRELTDTAAEEDDGGAGGRAAEDGDAPGDAAELSIADARSEIVRRWASRAGGRGRLPAEAGSVVFNLLASALEPERASRRFIADWYLRTARESLEEDGVDETERRRLFTALMRETRSYLESSPLAEDRALLLGANVSRRLSRALPEVRGADEDGDEDEEASAAAELEASAAPAPEAT